MTPEEPDFLTPEGNDLIAAYQRGYRRGLEDAAKVAEDYAGYKVNWYEAAQDITSAIREKAKQ